MSQRNNNSQSDYMVPTKIRKVMSINTKVNITVSHENMPSELRRNRKTHISNEATVSGRRRNSVYFNQTNRVSSEIALLNYSSSLLYIKALKRSRLFRTSIKLFDAKKMWKKYVNKIKPILLLNKLAQEIQLFGSPACLTADYHYITMIKSITNKDANTINSKDRLPFHLIDPKNNINLVWMSILIVQLIFTAFIAPIRIAFQEVNSFYGAIIKIMEKKENKNFMI